MSSPVAGATVAITDGPNAGKSTTTDGSGNYSLTGLQQANVTATASADGFVSQSQKVSVRSVRRCLSA